MKLNIHLQLVPRLRIVAFIRDVWSMLSVG
jgi:hypothetical protein